MEIWPGRPYPLGATPDADGTNFAVFSPLAERVELCLFDEDGTNEVRLSMPESTAHCWHGFVPGRRPGQPATAIGSTVEWNPAAGLLANPAKLLLDPYARAISGTCEWGQACYGYRFGAPDKPNDADSAPYMPRNVVADPAFDWGDDRPPRIPLHESMIYEAHVKGLTALHPTIPAELRGTYAGLATPGAIEHLTLLGRDGHRAHAGPPVC